MSCSSRSILILYVISDKIKCIINRTVWGGAPWEADLGLHWLPSFYRKEMVIFEASTPTLYGQYTDVSISQGIERRTNRQPDQIVSIRHMHFKDKQAVLTVWMKTNNRPKKIANKAINV